MGNACIRTIDAFYGARNFPIVNRRSSGASNSMMRNLRAFA
jgi:hypothetical protein